SEPRIRHRVLKGRLHVDLDVLDGRVGADPRHHLADVGNVVHRERGRSEGNDEGRDQHGESRHRESSLEKARECAPRASGVKSKLCAAPEKLRGSLPAPGAIIQPRSVSTETMSPCSSVSFWCAKVGPKLAYRSRTRFSAWSRVAVGMRRYWQIP